MKNNMSPLVEVTHQRCKCIICLTVLLCSSHVGKCMGVQVSFHFIKEFLRRRLSKISNFQLVGSLVLIVCMLSSSPGYCINLKTSFKWIIYRSCFAWQFPFQTWQLAYRTRIATLFVHLYAPSKTWPVYYPFKASFQIDAITRTWR
jgi:hypothetical protein